MRIIDAHLHHRVGRRYQREHNPRTLIESGVVQGGWLLSVNGYKDGHATDRETLALCRRYPRFFMPFGYLDFRRDVGQIEAHRRAGCVGLKTIWPEEPYDAPRYFPFYDCAQALRMPIVFHCGGAYYEPPCRRRTAEGAVIAPHQTYGRNMLPIHLDTIAKQFPRLVIVIAHLGGDIAYFEQAALICRGHAGVGGRAMMYLDLSSELAYWGLPALVKVKQVLDTVGSRCLLYGSDAPYPYAVEVARFWKFFFSLCLRLDAADVARIMGGNAEAIVAEARR